jgi:hypothetical protein
VVGSSIGSCRRARSRGKSVRRVLKMPLDAGLGPDHDSVEAYGAAVQGELQGRLDAAGAGYYTQGRL